METQKPIHLQEEELVTFVKQRVEEARASNTRITTEAIWLTNTAYLLGFQVSYDVTTRSFKPIAQAEPYMRRSRIQINEILPRAQNRLARLTKNRPKYQVLPSSNDIEDKEAARFAEKLCDNVWTREKMDAKLYSLYGWMQQCGHSYFKINWDPTLGKRLPTQELEYEGDVRLDVVSAFEVFPDPLAKDMIDCAWLIQAKVRRLDYFKRQYPERGAEVKAEGAWLLSAQYENRINGITFNSGQTSNSDEMMKDAAIELSYYERASKEHPNGRLIICANGVLLSSKELPVGEIPFVKFDDVMVSGKYYSESLITHARPIQDQLNRIYARRAAWVNKLLAGKYLAARGSGLDQEGLNNESGEIVYYDPVPNAGAPQAMTIPVMPSYIYQEETEFRARLDDLFGTSEISRGQPAGGLTAAIALAFMVEQDDTRIGIVTRRNELCMAQTMRLALMYIQKFYVTPRKVRIAGPNGDFLVKEFTGADIRDAIDVVVAPGSTLPGSLTAKRDFILALYNQGLLGPVGDPKTSEKVLKFLEFGDVAEVWGDQSIDYSQIRRGLELIERGEVPEINELDNHPAWVDELNKYRKTEKYMRLDDLAKGALETTIEGHLQELINITNPQVPLEDQIVKNETSMEAGL